METMRTALQLEPCIDMERGDVNVHRLHYIYLCDSNTLGNQTQLSTVAKRHCPGLGQIHLCSCNYERRSGKETSRLSVHLSFAWHKCFRETEELAEEE